jgi:hypothetical protein
VAQAPHGAGFASHGGLRTISNATCRPASVKLPVAGWWLRCPKIAVAEVTQAGEDELSLVEATIDDRGIDAHVGMVAMK